jgi:hypothetical protein
MNDSAGSGPVRLVQKRRRAHDETQAAPTGTLLRATFLRAVSARMRECDVEFGCVLQ